MFYDARNEAALACAQRRSVSLRKVLAGAVERARTALTRRRQRQELFEYLASDHRAAADIGISNGEARALSRTPFWRL